MVELTVHQLELKQFSGKTLLFILITELTVLCIPSLADFP